MNVVKERSVFVRLTKSSDAIHLNIITGVSDGSY